MHGLVTRREKRRARRELAHARQFLFVWKMNRHLRKQLRRNPNYRINLEDRTPWVNRVVSYESLSAIHLNEQGPGEKIYGTP